MNPKFWKNKRVLITGHTGFKGSWLSLWLQELQANLIGYALPPPTKPSLFVLAQVKKGMSSLEKDIRDFNAVLATLKEYQPEIVIHMAAQPIVRQSYEQPVETYETNVMGTVHLLEAIRRTKGVRVVINVTTDKCYENRDWVWGYRECESLGGNDPYSNSKACSEMATSAFRNSFFLPSRYSQHDVAIASARAGNVIGGGDWAKDRLVPDCVRAWLKGEKVSIRCPQAVRPWQHVLEPLAGYILLAEKLYEEGALYSEAWNFGPDAENAKSVRDVVEQFALFWNGEFHWEAKPSEDFREANCLRLDSSKAKAKLGWTPKWDLTTTLRKVAEWYQVYQEERRRVRQKTLEQIQEYME